jgi:hypothetical protein
VQRSGPLCAGIELAHRIRKNQFSIGRSCRRREGSRKAELAMDGVDKSTRGRGPTPLTPARIARCFDDDAHRGSRLSRRRRRTNPFSERRWSTCQYPRDSGVADGISRKVARDRSGGGSMPSLADRWRWAAVMIVGGCSAAAGAQDLDLVNATLVEGAGAAPRSGPPSAASSTARGSTRRRSRK